LDTLAFLAAFAIKSPTLEAASTLPPFLIFGETLDAEANVFVPQLLII